MDVVIFGGPRDGEVISIPKGTLAWRVVETDESQIKSSTSMPTSPFGSPVKVEFWKVFKKSNYWSDMEYLILMEPRIEKWMLESFGNHNEGK